MFACCSGKPTQDQSAPVHDSHGITPLVPQNPTEANVGGTAGSLAQAPATVDLSILHGFERRSYLDDYILGGEILGKGAFGDVVLAQRKDASAQRAAIKLVHFASLQNDKEVEALQKECDVLSKCQAHENICQLFKVYQTSSELAMVMELIPGGDLFDGIVNAPHECLNEAFAATVLERTCRALEYLHEEMDVAHRDIKPENIMLVGQGGVENQDLEGPVCKLADFGFATFCACGPGDLPGSTLYTMCGSPEYVAPECLLDRKYGYQCDMWSLGVTAYVCLCGYPPFYETDSQNKLFREIIKGEFEFPVEEWGQISPEAKKLIQCMLNVEPEERISAAQARAHPWISANVHREIDGKMVLPRNPSNTPLPAALKLHTRLLEFSKMAALRKFRTAGKVAILTARMNLSKNVQGIADSEAGPS